MNASFPQRGDREAARQWLWERRGIQASSHSTTHEAALRRQRDRLLARAGLALTSGSDGAPRLDVVLDGAAIVGHSAPVSMLGSVLTSLQETVTAVAQALDGVPTAVGRIAGYISAATQLRSVASFPSSYGMRLEGPVSVAEWQQDYLPVDGADDTRAVDGSSRRLLADAIDALMNITNLANQVTDVSNEPLVESLAPLGQRAVSHLVALANILAVSDTGLRLMWQPETEHTRTAALTSGAAARLRSVSEDIQFAEAVDRRIEGKLIEASLRNGSIIIVLDSGTALSARTEPTVTPRLGQDLLGKRVVADTLMTVARYAGGRRRETYIVTDIASAETEQ